MKNLIKLEIQTHYRSYLMQFLIIALYLIVVRSMMMDHTQPDHKGPAFIANFMMFTLFIPWHWVRNKMQMNAKMDRGSDFEQPSDKENGYRALSIPESRLPTPGRHSLSSRPWLHGWMPVFSWAQYGAIIIVCISMTTTALALEFLWMIF